MLLSTGLRNSHWRGLASTLYRPAPVLMSYGTENGEELIQLRLVPKAGRSRITYPLIGSNHQFLDAFSEQSATQPA